MSTVTLERTLPASALRVFEMVSQPQNMVRWWGHNGMIVPEHNLDFTKPGPWFSVMQMTDGGQKKVSGMVTEVDPPRFIAFTWAWHNENGERGHESHVTIEIAEAGDDQAKMTLSHHGLPTDEARAGHTTGWLAIFEKLEKGLA